MIPDTLFLPFPSLIIDHNGSVPVLQTGSLRRTIVTTTAALSHTQGIALLCMKHPDKVLIRRTPHSTSVFSSKDAKRARSKMYHPKYQR